MTTINWEDFQKVELRVGTILRVEPFPEARKPAYQIWVDLGPELGVKKSSAQLTDLYEKESLVGTQVLCVCNFPPRQIGPFRSEILITGLVLDEGERQGNVVLVRPDQKVPNGIRLA